MWRNFENATITGHLSWLSKTPVEEYHDCRYVIVFEKLRIQNAFRLHEKRKDGVFNFLRFEECFRKAPFSVRISVDGSPNHINKGKSVKAAFSNFLWCGVDAALCITVKDDFAMDFCLLLCIYFLVVNH